MMNGRKVFRWTLSACLVAVLAVAGAGLYQMNTKEEVKEIGLEEDWSAQETETITEEWTEQVDTEYVEGTKEVEEPEQAEESAAPVEEDAAPIEETASTEIAQPEAPVETVMDFTEDSLMEWPVNGEILLDYSMDQTIYYPTLDLYKYNPAIMVAADVNTPVLAAANGQVVSIGSNEETGVTVTLDMGNGYQAIYGQLKEVAFSEGDVIESGTIIGYISEPTKYYCMEGSNLYFAMTKDGAALDPLMYLP